MPIYGVTDSLFKMAEVCIYPNRMVGNGRLYSLYAFTLGHAHGHLINVLQCCFTIYKTDFKLLHYESGAACVYEGMYNRTTIIAVLIAFTDQISLIIIRSQINKTLHILNAKCIVIGLSTTIITFSCTPGVRSFCRFHQSALVILDWESGATVPHTQYSNVWKHTWPVHSIFCFATMFYIISTMCSLPSFSCILYSGPKHWCGLCVVQCTDVCW
jgi:hypothetical protein